MGRMGRIEPAVQLLHQVTAVGQAGKRIVKGEAPVIGACLVDERKVVMDASPPQQVEQAVRVRPLRGFKGLTLEGLGWDHSQVAGYSSQ